MAKIMKKAADGYTSYGSKAGTPSPVTDYAGKTSKPDSYTQYKKGGVIKKKAQNGYGGNMVSKIKSAAKKADSTVRKTGMNPSTNPYKRVADLSRTPMQKLLSKDKEEMKKGGMMKKKAKSGGSFPDLNKDGKITKADILKGRGVIAKKGIKTAKKMMKNGGMLAAPTKGGVSMQLGSYTRQIGKNYTGKNVVNKGAKAKMGKSMGKCKYGC